jgi:hypothetical protein
MPFLEILSGPCAHLDKHDVAMVNETLCEVLYATLSGNASKTNRLPRNSKPVWLANGSLRQVEVCGLREITTTPAILSYCAIELPTEENIFVELDPTANALSNESSTLVR